MAHFVKNFALMGMTAVPAGNFRPIWDWALHPPVVRGTATSAGPAAAGDLRWTSLRLVQVVVAFVLACAAGGVPPALALPASVTVTTATQLEVMRGDQVSIRVPLAVGA